MTSQSKLVQLGEWPASAAACAGGDYSTVTLSVANSQTATVSGSGTNQTSVTASTALAGATYQLSADIANFTTVGTAFITVFNSGANTVLIYPPVGGTINGQAVNIPFGVAASKSTTFITPDGLIWFAAHAG
jgi:hypothetical protein